jgi:hypothetical protein
MAELSAPVPLLATHVTDEFDNGEPVLNDVEKASVEKREFWCFAHLCCYISLCFYSEQTGYKLTQD